LQKPTSDDDSGAPELDSPHRVEQQASSKELGVFGRYLTAWVAICIVVGVAIGEFVPAVPDTLSEFIYAQVSIPVAILIWLMIFPMMVQIDFASILGVRAAPEVADDHAGGELADQAVHDVLLRMALLRSDLLAVHQCRAR
jgi:ACR3 family arsenite transporter